MKAFALHQRFFTWLCIKPSKSMNIFNVIFILIALSSQLLCFISSSIFIYEFISNDLENALFAVFQMVATASGFYTLIVVLTIRHSIVDVLKKFQEFCDTCEFHLISLNLEILQSISNSRSIGYHSQMLNAC